MNPENYREIFLAPQIPRHENASINVIISHSFIHAIQLAHLRKRQSSGSPEPAATAAGASEAMFNEVAPALKGVVGAVPEPAPRHPAGCALASCTPGVKAGTLASRNLDAPEH